MNKKLFTTLAAASLVAFTMALPRPVSAHQYTEIRIFASGAVEKPIREIGYLFEKKHPNVQLHYEFADSRVFYIGIVQGIPPDLFVSAGTKLQNKLTDAAFINFADTVAYSRLDVASACEPPPCCRAPGEKPVDLEKASVNALISDPGIDIAAPGATLSVAGQRFEHYLANHGKARSRSGREGLSHISHVVSPGIALRKVEQRETQLGVVYAAQVAGARRMGKCIRSKPIPGVRAVPFTVAVLQKSKFHFVGPERARLDRELKSLYLSKTGQRIFEQWGFRAAK